MHGTQRMVGVLFALALAACGSTSPAEQLAALQLAATSPAPAPGVSLQAELINVSESPLLVSACVGLIVEQRISGTWTSLAAPLCQNGPTSAVLAPGAARQYTAWLGSSAGIGTYRLRAEVAREGAAAERLDVIREFRIVR